MEVTTGTPTTTTIAIQSPQLPYEVVESETEESDTTSESAESNTSEIDGNYRDADESDDAEVLLFTSSPTTVRGPSREASPGHQRTTSLVTAEVGSRSSKPMLCTPTLMQRVASASTSSDGHPLCLICLEPFPLGTITGAQQIRVSNIPVGLVCDCTVHAHPACLARWLQRTLACPICHCAAQFRPRPGQVVRTSATHYAYQQLQERETTRQLDYAWEIRRRQCIHVLQCSCALGFLGMLAWAFAAYSAISSPSSG